MAGIKTACHHGPADQLFRAGIAEYLRVTYADRAALCILRRVIVGNGKALTRHWMLRRTRLFERFSL